jgi:hypothetical protein
MPQTVPIFCPNSLTACIRPLDAAIQRPRVQRLRLMSRLRCPCPSSPSHRCHDAGRLEAAIHAGHRPDLTEWAEEESSGGPEGMLEVVEAYCHLAQLCWQQDPAQRPAFAGTVYPQLKALAERCPA